MSRKWPHVVEGINGWLCLCQYGYGQIIEKPTMDAMEMEKVSLGIGGQVRNLEAA
jgi:hypothetical protein